VSKWKSRQDTTTGEVVSALRAAGAIVRHIDGAMGIPGVPDLLVGYQGVTYLMEVKGPKGRLSDAQVAFHAEWKGGPLVTVRTAPEALAALGIAVAA
jgi:hypothetical protein